MLVRAAMLFDTNFLRAKNSRMDLSALKYGRVADSGYFRVWNTEALDPPELLTLLPGAVYSKNYEGWYVPYNVLGLILNGTDNSKGIIEREYQTPTGLKLSRIQNAAIQFVEQTPFGCIIGIGTGLGKTLIALEFARQHPELRPILVAGPCDSSDVWLSPDGDPAKHYGLTSTWIRTRSLDISQFHDGTGKKFDIYFINYEILSAWKTAINATLKPKLVILDEADEVCNVRTASSKAAESICGQKTVGKRILLTATPVNNEVMELYGLLTKAQPRLWGRWIDFGIRYAGGYEDEFGWHMHDESNVDELVRRLKYALFSESSVKDWTTLHRDAELIPPEALLKGPMAEYKLAATDIHKLLALQGKSHQGAALQQYGILARALSKAKLDYAITAARRFVFDLPRQKAVIFTWFRETAEVLVRGLQQGKTPLHVYGPLLGGGSFSKKQSMVTTFASDPEPSCIVATLETAKRSRNQLSAAQGVFFVDMWYVPGSFLQAEGRINRRGQTAEDIYSRTLLAPNTMDTLMWKYMERKARLIEKTAGSEAASLVEALGGRGKKETVQSLMADLAELRDEDLELV